MRIQVKMPCGHWKRNVLIQKDHQHQPTIALAPCTQCVTPVTPVTSPGLVDTEHSKCPPWHTPECGEHNNKTRGVE